MQALSQIIAASPAVAEVLCICEGKACLCRGRQDLPLSESESYLKLDFHLLVNETQPNG